MNYVYIFALIMNIKKEITDQLPSLKNDVRTLNSLVVFLEEINKICYQINDSQKESNIRIEVVIEDKIKP